MAAVRRPLGDTSQDSGEGQLRGVSRKPREFSAEDISRRLQEAGDDLELGDRQLVCLAEDDRMTLAGEALKEIDRKLQAQGLLSSAGIGKTRHQKPLPSTSGTSRTEVMYVYDEFCNTAKLSLLALHGDDVFCNIVRSSLLVMWAGGILLNFWRLYVFGKTRHQKPLPSTSGTSRTEGKTRHQKPLPSTSGTSRTKKKKEKNIEEFEDFFKCAQCPSEDHAIKIRPEMVLDEEGDNTTYRLNCTEAGSFCCYITDLIFDVRAAVTISYHFDSWSEHLNEEHREQLEIIGPLINIQADPEEAVAAVRFPHFLCLAGEGHSKICIAHFVEEGMSLEKPDTVGPFHVELKNPTFSPYGPVIKKSWFNRKITAHAVVLLYQDLAISVPKFHLYLLPNDSSLRKAVHEDELKYGSQRVRKPPETMKPLETGSHFFLQKINDVSVCPEKLEFKYLSADMEQQYLELFADHMEDGLELSLLEENTNDLVWEANIRKEELLSSTIFHPVQEKHLLDSSGMHFIERHREALIGRTRNVEAVLDMLYWTVLNHEQYEKILSRTTSQDKMRELYMLVPSWNHFCKDRLYEALKVKEKFIIYDLERR